MEETIMILEYAVLGAGPFSERRRKMAVGDIQCLRRESDRVNKKTVDDP